MGPSRGQFKRLLVPIDLFGEAERAIAPALALTGRSGGTVCFFGWSSDEGEAAVTRRHLRDLAQAVADTWSVEVPVEVRLTQHRCAAPAIAAAAREHDATVVMATHARSGIGHAALGSTAEHTLRLLDDPVVLVGPYADGARSRNGTELLVAVDGSALSDQLVPAARDWAAELALTVRLIHAVEPRRPPEESIIRSREDLRDLADRSGCEGAKTTLVGGDPSHAIAEFARPDTFLAAVTTHGRSGFARTVLGSVAMQIVHRAPCPVVVLRPES